MSAMPRASGDAPQRIIDMWAMAQGMDEPAAGGSLLLGRSPLSEVKPLLGLDADETMTTDRGDGFVGWHCGATFAQFDAEGRISGLGYGDYQYGRQITPAVETAVARLDSYGDRALDAELALGPNAVLRYHGFRAHQFTTLPRFISVSREIQGFQLSSWPEDKTISLRRDTPRAALFATFALKAFKTEYTEHFQLDYCLSWLAVFTQASLTSLISDRPAPSN